MFLSSHALIALVAIASLTSAQDLKVDTPSSVVQCLPVEITWLGGSPPYYPSIQSGDMPMSDALMSLPTQTSGNALTWVANIPAGTSIIMAMRDMTGKQVFSAAVTIQKSSDASCLASTMSMTTETMSTSIITMSTTTNTGSMPTTTNTGITRVSMTSTTRVASVTTSVGLSTATTTTNSADGLGHYGNSGIIVAVIGMLAAIIA